MIKSGLQLSMPNVMHFSDKNLSPVEIGPQCDVFWGKFSTQLSFIDERVKALTSS